MNDFLKKQIKYWDSIYQRSLIKLKDQVKKTKRCREMLKYYKRDISPDPQLYLFYTPDEPVLLQTRQAWWRQKTRA